jgi:SapC
MTSEENGSGGQNSEEHPLHMKGIPIFYERPEILDSERHKALGLIDSTSLLFAVSSNAIPINAAEFPLASRDYPIVFIGDEEINSVAIVGLRKDENLMVNQAGQWAQDTYIPAYVRRYPFIFVRQEGGSQYALCIDRASDRIGTDTDKAFFNGTEKTETSEKAMEFCTLFQRHYLATETIIKQLREYDLLVTHQIQFTLPNDNTLNLKDFKVIDEKRLTDLPDNDFIALRKTGALATAYCHLVSLNSWQGLYRRISALVAN